MPGTFSETLLTGLTPGDEYTIEVKGIENGNPVPVYNVNIGTSDFVLGECCAFRSHSLVAHYMWGLGNVCCYVTICDSFKLLISYKLLCVQV